MERSPDLPQDILRRIFTTLEIPDLVRAGSVCYSWRAAYTSLCSTGLLSMHQTPCLLYTETAGARAAGLYSLTEKKAYVLTLPDPPIRSRYIIGSSYGWIVTADERSEIHLVNPITGEQIALPSVTTIEQVKPIFDGTGTICSYKYSWYTGTIEKVISDSPSIFAFSELRDFLFDKVFLSSDPSMGDYFVVLIHNPHSQLSFTRAGDKKWTWLPPNREYEDCLFKGGLLYASTKSGEIHEFDLGTPAVTRKIFLNKVKDIYCERIYIIQAPCGDFLQIWRYRTPQLGDEGQYGSDLEVESNPESNEFNTSMLKIHKVELTSKMIAEISSLDDNVLFLGHNQSLCLRAEQYPQLKSNHVYFTDDDYTYVTGSKNGRRDIGVFDMENKSCEEIVSPQIWSNWPAPVWLTPNPRRLNVASRS
ncbi:hypothetical protein QOZ80_9BG0712280 [Eleusine coracana subsp. coracana]|nr:hypothetical protein QOZ80_9BG0712280 [Eleusine coracana subsp. coracana]